MPDEKSNLGTIDFQISDWNWYHEIDSDAEDKYVVQLFGRTVDDKDVCLKVENFEPYFYVKVPKIWKKAHIEEFIRCLKRKVSYITSDNDKFEYDLSESLIDYKTVRKKEFHNFTNKELFQYVKLKFKSYLAMREFSNVLMRPLSLPNLTKEPVIYGIFEANIEPHIRLMHIRDLLPCGWISLDLSVAKHVPEYSNCDHTYFIDWKKLNKSTTIDDKMAPFKIMGYDIECTTPGQCFPRADKKPDRIIQIGMTMYRYGSMQCYDQHMLTLKKCSRMDNTNIYCYKTEKGLLRGWAEKMSKIRPDFVAGYNNFGFDDVYIFDRIMRIDREEAAKQGLKSVDKLENKFIDEILQILGKLNNAYIMKSEGLKQSLSKFIIKDLSSSALGDNKLKFFQCPGTITIDMMKIIQRENRLPGYKLDNVSANFITEKIVRVDSEPVSDDNNISLMIYTKSTKALELDSYVQIMVDDGYSASPLSNRAKYHVDDIKTVTDTKTNDKYQCICTKIPTDDYAELRAALDNSLLKVFWTFAKDDMHHTTIHRNYESGDPEKIKEVAKYCIKDCKLVNLLLAKLDTIVNNVAMANVCHVPLSYLFLRGQGVKIFSLVSKKCRELGYLIPVHRKLKTDIDYDNNESYEGATVINPKPGVYLSPIGVLDFSSLYPNSMREANLSQECYVKDKKYDNLPGYIYHDVYITKKDSKGKIIRNIDGSPQREHHRYAQELVSEEQILIEMKDVIEKINNKYDLEIEAVKKKKFFTTDDIGTIETEAAKGDDKSNNPFKKIMKNILKIKGDKKLNELNSETADKLKNILKKIVINDEIKNSLLATIKSKIDNEILFERSRKYNIVDGKTVRYGILPQILTELLNKRKDTNGRLARETDPFKKAILNALQLAFKITANSLYGQTGAPTSPIFFVAIAACTTAIGRKRLHFAKKVVEDNFPGSEIIYGDTDSIFINFHIKDENGVDRTDKVALVETIELAKKAAKKINELVPKPQSIVYEKTYHPLILPAKKKYVGMLYEDNVDECFMKSMGIVLKRRDNAPIVKIVVGGIIENILKHRDIGRAIAHLRNSLDKLMDGKYPMDKFIISKSLKGRYANPMSIAHKVLADRMAERDPGNKPQVNDRIPYVYIVKNFSNKKKKDILQGELVENPDFVVKNGLKIDYLYYLEHQIMKPTKQILELVMPSKSIDRLFNYYINQEMNKRLGAQSIMKWIGNDNEGDSNIRVELSPIIKKNNKEHEYINNTYDSRVANDKIIDDIVKKASFNSNKFETTNTFIGNSKKVDSCNMERWMVEGNYDTVEDFKPPIRNLTNNGSKSSRIIPRQAEYKPSGGKKKRKTNPKNIVSKSKSIKMFTE